jgi:hypothetical protein
LTNVVRIVSREWLSWLKRGPTAHQPPHANGLAPVPTRWHPCQPVGTHHTPAYRHRVQFGENGEPHEEHRLKQGRGFAGTTRK